MLGLVLVLGWPPARMVAMKGTDTTSYLAWPGHQPFAPGTFGIGPRPPVYPLVLKVCGLGVGLVWFQCAVSALAWCLLGWVLARHLGVVLGGLFALAPTIWMRNVFALTESLSLSLMALLLAQTLLLARKWSWSRFGGFLVLLFLFGFVRDQNLFMIPFFCVAALFHPRRRAVLILAVGALVFGVGSIAVRLNDRWQWGLTNTILSRVLPDPQARTFFQAAGMPLNAQIMGSAGKQGSQTIYPLQKNQPELFRWINRAGLKTHYRYILARPDAYWLPWQALNTSYREESFQWYVSSRLWYPHALLYARWLYGCVIPPLHAYLLLGIFLGGLWRLERPGKITALIGLAMLLATYVQAFITYHADTCEIVRHQLTCFILYRLVNGLALVVLSSLIVKSIAGWRNNGLEANRILTPVALGTTELRESLEPQRHEPLGQEATRVGERIESTVESDGER